MNMLANAYIASIILTGSVSFAKIPAAPVSTQTTKSSALSDKSLMEELTGKKQVVTPTAQAQAQMNNLKKAPLSVQHYYAGQKAVEQKNYILAIKHFNTVIKNYPLSAQVKPALVAKAKVYQEMGLQKQAQRNMQLAKLNTVLPAPLRTANKNQMATVQQKNKITK